VITILASGFYDYVSNSTVVRRAVYRTEKYV